MKIAMYEVRDDELSIIQRIARDWKVDIITTKDNLTFDTIHFCDGCNGVSTLGQSQLDKTILDQLHEQGITCVSTRTIGYNHIDVDYAKEIGMMVCNASYDPEGVAEYTVMFMMLVLRKYKAALWRGQVNDFSLDGLQGRHLKNMTVGVMGTGRIGKTVIRILNGYGCRVLAYDTHPSKDLESLATYVSLDQLYRESDIITLHMPLLTSTYHIINKWSVSKMKKGVIIINCARGELMDISDMIDLLEKGQIGGLGLDTVESEEGLVHQDRRNEILAYRDIAYIRQFPNVVYTQHMAFYTQEAVESMVICGIDGILEMYYNHKYQTML